MAIRTIKDTNHGRAKAIVVDTETGLSATGRDKPWFGDVTKHNMEQAESKALERLAKKIADEAKRHKR